MVSGFLYRTDAGAVMFVCLHRCRCVGDVAARGVGMAERRLTGAGGENVQIEQSKPTVSGRCAKGT